MLRWRPRKAGSVGAYPIGSSSSGAACVPSLHMEVSRERITVDVHMELMQATSHPACSLYLLEIAALSTGLFVCCCPSASSDHSHAPRLPLPRDCGGGAAGWLSSSERLTQAFSS